MKSVLLCAVVQVVALISITSSQRPVKRCGLPNYECIEQRYCLDSRYGGKPFSVRCSTEAANQGVCCDLSKTTKGKDCLLGSNDGKCVTGSRCRPYHIRMKTRGINQWNTSSNVCYKEAAQNYYCCPKQLVKSLESTTHTSTGHVETNVTFGVERNEVTNSQLKPDNVFSTCETPYKRNGHSVPLRLCDDLYQLYRKGHHINNKQFENWPLSGNDATPICCPTPSGESSLIMHEKAKKLGLSQCGSAILDDKILNGQRAGLGQYPWMANLLYKDKYNKKLLVHKCGGSLIHPRYVLTAAHCRDTKNAVIPEAVRLGEYDLSKEKDCEDNHCADPYRQYRIAKWIPHSGYRYGKQQNDIALIRLKPEVKPELGHIFPICLPLTTSLLMLKPKKLTVTGWGLTSSGNISNVLQKVDVVNVNDGRFDVCSAGSTFCARGTRMEGNCKGDSGGPLQTIVPYENTYRTVLFGIVSAGGRECSVENNAPGVSVLVGYYIHWILDNMDI